FYGEDTSFFPLLGTSDKRKAERRVHIESRENKSRKPLYKYLKGFSFQKKVGRGFASIEGILSHVIFGIFCGKSLSLSENEFAKASFQWIIGFI
ncbi:MAG: hypothetical protein D6797_02675, partial [Bdellovibrio sp.]